MRWFWPLLLALALTGCPGDSEGGYMQGAPEGLSTTQPRPVDHALGGDAPDDVLPAIAAGG